MSADCVIEVRAIVELFPGARSGKTKGYSSGVRPNHYFDGEDFSSVGVVEFTAGDSLELGAVGEAKVRFIRSIDAKPIQVGTRWRICEGNREVGTGQIVQLLACRKISGDDER